MGKTLLVGAACGLAGFLMGTSDWAAKQKLAAVAANPTATGTPAAVYAGAGAAGAILAFIGHKAFGPKAA